MKNRLAVWSAALALVLAVAVGTLLTARPAAAAPQDAYEYAYFAGVPRLESYEIDLSRWAGSEEEKDYVRGHVFVYQTGQTTFENQHNSLKRLNELSAQGWELWDADAGVLRRRK